MSIAVEVINAFALGTDVDTLISHLQLEDVEILRAIVFGDDLSGVETIFSSFLVDCTEQAVMDE